MDYSGPERRTARDPEYGGPYRRADDQEGVATRAELAAEVEELRVERARLLEARREEQFADQREATETALEVSRDRSDKRQAAAGVEAERLRLATASDLEQVRVERAEILEARVKLEAERLRVEATRGLEVNRRASDVRSAEGEIETRGEAARLARQVSQDALVLAEKRGEERATLNLWQRGIEKHNLDQNGALRRMDASLEKLAERVTDIVQGLATKRAQDVVLADEVRRQAEVSAKASISTVEFRKWVVGLIVAIFLAFAASRGFRF